VKKYTKAKFYLVFMEFSVVLWNRKIRKKQKLQILSSREPAANASKKVNRASGPHVAYLRGWVNKLPYLKDHYDLQIYRSGDLSGLWVASGLPRTKRQSFRYTLWLSPGLPLTFTPQNLPEFLGFLVSLSPLYFVAQLYLVSCKPKMIVITYLIYVYS